MNCTYLKTSKNIINKLISLPEKFFIQAIRLKNSFPPLFIVGPLRSGTTLIYLHLINTFNFAYFPNISKRHPQACVSYVIYGKLFYRYQPTYRNSYGIIDGPMAPSDGWGIFQRWFPKDNYSQKVKLDWLYELRNIVRLFEISFQAPFANKNNANSVHIRYLHQVFPDAFFLRVKRNIADTVLSLMEARKQHGTELNEWWGVPPPQFYDQQFSSELEQAVYQTWGVKVYIQKSLEHIPVDKWFSISYESFCREPVQVERWVCSKYAEANIILKRRQSPLLYSFQARSRISPKRIEMEKKIAEIVDRLERTSFG